jgi:hypothetical protein
MRAIVALPLVAFSLTACSATFDLNIVSTFQPGALPDVDGLYPLVYAAYDGDDEALITTVICAPRNGTTELTQTWQRPGKRCAIPDVLDVGLFHAELLDANGCDAASEVAVLEPVADRLQATWQRAETDTCETDDEGQPSFRVDFVYQAAN